MMTQANKLSTLRAMIAVSIVAALLVGTISTFAQPGLHAAAKPLAATANLPTTSTMVINEIQTGAATAGDEFIELYNAGGSPYDLNGHRVVYRSAAGTTDATTFAVFTGTQLLPPGGYFLVCSTGFSNQSLCDATYASGGMAQAGGGVALRNGPVNTGTIIDSLGYGTATNAFIEGMVAPAPPNSNPPYSLSRIPNGSDSDNNAADFRIEPSTPRAMNVDVPQATSTPTSIATNTATPGGPTNTPVNTPTATLTPGPGLRIHDIQAASHLSPYSGTLVSSIPGLVTALRSNGFYLQDPNPDSNPATSEGVFIFTSSAPTVSVGDSVVVTGTVTEFRSGGSGGAANLTTTEISNPGRQVTVISSGNPLPAPIVIGNGGRVPPNTIIEDDASGDVETSGVFDPDQDGIDFYESLESMRVQVNDAVVVGPTVVFGSGNSQNSEIDVAGDNGANASVRTPRGGLIIRPTDFNPERIIFNDVILRSQSQSLPIANVNDHFPGAAIGVMDYSFGNFKLQLTQNPTFVSGGLAQEITADRTGDQLEVATFNVENLSPADPITKFNTLANLMVNNLKAPDLISVEEIQDSDGPVDDGVVSATLTYSMLQQAVLNAGGPAYDYRQIDPVNDQDGGQPGGNIRQGFFFRTDRGFSFIDHPGGGSTITTTVTCNSNMPQLSFSPGRIAPNDPAWTSSRKPLAGEFMFHGHHLFAIGNHFISKLGDQPLFGHFQPSVLASEAQRIQQAQIVHDFTNNILTCDPNADVVILGDLNDYEFSPPLLTLKGSPQILYALIETLPQPERYTYDYQGNSETLDHILVSPHIFNTIPLVDDVVHVNSEFSIRASDHEPHVARFTLPLAIPTITATPNATMTNTPGGPTNTPIASVTPTDCPNPFVDINNNVFYFAIHYLYCRGVVNGTDAAHYSPGGTSTRAQFAKVVVLGFGETLYTPSSGQDFTDVPPSYWAYVYIETGFHNGILSGFNAAGCTAYGATYPCYVPNIAITRGQLTKLVVLAGGYQLYTPTGGAQDFSDVPPNYVFYVSIETAFHNNIINGYPDGTFRPNNNIRRDEMAQIVYEGIIHRP